MTTYAFNAITDIKAIADAHLKRGFRVLVVGMAWNRVQVLAKSLGMATTKDQAMVVTSLARQVYEQGKTGGELFNQPTLVVVGGDEPMDEAATAWGRIQEAAVLSHSEVVFAHTRETAGVN